jgi:hypothetical protein
MKIHSWMRTKRFWFIFIGFLVFMFLADITVTFTVMTRSLASGRWDHVLLGVGLIYAGITAFRSFFSTEMNKHLNFYTRLLWLFCLVWSIRTYGFWSGMYFIATITILARFLGWGLKAMSRLTRRKQQSGGFRTESSVLRGRIIP